MIYKLYLKLKSIDYLKGISFICYILLKIFIISTWILSIFSGPCIVLLSYFMNNVNNDLMRTLGIIVCISELLIVIVILGLYYKEIYYE